MPITTYDELQAAIADWLARGDLAARIPDFVALAEQRIFYGAADAAFPSPPLRVRAMEETADPASYVTTAGAPSLALPDGFLEMRAIRLETEPPTAPGFATARQLAALGAAQGRPRLYTISGDALRFAPTPDAAYGVALTYYRKFDPLSVSPTNWLLANAPGVYLYAALLEAQPFLVNDARLPMWAAMLGASARALMEADQAARWGGPLTIRRDAAAP